MRKSWQRLHKLIVGTSWVAAGSVIGQALVLLATPFLARAYGAEKLGVYAAFAALSSILVAVSTLRYEIVIPIVPDNDAPSAALFCVCASATLAATCALGLVAGGGIALNQWFQLGDAIYLLPLVLLLGGIGQTGNYLSIRAGELHINGMQRLLNPATFVVAAIFIPAVGLPLAHTTGLLCGLMLLWIYRFKIGRSIVSSIKFAGEHWYTSARLLPAALMDACAIALPVTIINYAYGAASAGEYSQVQRLIVGPLLLLAVATSHAVHSEGSRLVRLGAPMRLLLRDVILVLAAIASIWIVIAATFGSPIVSMLLGNGWRSDSAFVLLILSGSILRFIISPLSTLLLTLNRHGVLLCWQSAFFVWVVGGLPVVAQTLPLDAFLVVFALIESVFYVVYLLIIRASVRHYDRLSPSITTS